MSADLRSRACRQSSAAALAILSLFAGCQPVETAHPKSVPQRVVTLAPNVTEMVFAIGAGSSVVGTDDFSDFPPAVRRLPKVGGVQPNIEKIIALRPDLVLANRAGLHPNMERGLASVHVPLIAVTTERLQSIADEMRRIGGRFDPQSAERAALELEARLKKQQRRRALSPRVMFVVWTDPLYVAGRNTFADDLYLLTGAQNAVTVNGWPQYSLESFVAAPPDILLYPDHSVKPEQVAALLRRAGTRRVDAIAVDENVFTRPGPRVTEAAARLNVILDEWEKRHWPGADVGKSGRQEVRQ